MTKLSVNINKVALIRNSRLSNLPNLVKVAQDCEAYGAQGITVHPRPDERHVRYSDIPALQPVVKTEFNIEGYPSETFLQLVEQHPPAQCTLVPDPPGVLTSNQGWDTYKNKELLTEVISRLQAKGIRVSIFVDPVARFVEGAKAAGADRIEFYTGDFANQYVVDPETAVKPHTEAAKIANDIGIGINAGHDLNLDNLKFYRYSVPGLLEVSIGHALVCDALYYGFQNTIQMYLRQLKM